jgi:hypothetical protein
MTDVVEDSLVADVARDQVKQVAPQETAIFPLLSEAYFRDPQKALESRGGKEEVLGFGVETGVVLLTPIVLAVTKEVVGFVAGEVVKSVQTQSSGLINDFVKKLFEKFRREADEKGERLPPPLTQEQIVRVRALAVEKGRQLQLSESQAGLLADSLVGGLATTA